MNASNEEGITLVKRRQGDQPLPIPNNNGDIQSLVIEDINARRQLGISRYGTPLQANNGRDMLLDAYEEAIDLTVYLRGVLAERVGPDQDNSGAGALESVVAVLDRAQAVIPEPSPPCPYCQPTLNRVRAILDEYRRWLDEHPHTAADAAVRTVIDGITEAFQEQQ